MIDNKNYNLEYKAIHKEVREDRFEIYGNFDYKYISNEGPINLFSAKISGNDFEICYTAKVNRGGWTMIGCNGVNVGYMPAVADLNYEYNYRYIEKLIIYVKEKSESIPTISNLSNLILPPENRVVHPTKNNNNNNKNKNNKDGTINPMM